RIRILHATPDLLLVTLVGVSLLRGSLFGATGGFFARLVVDPADLGTLGLTSLLLPIAGYWIRRYGGTTGRHPAHEPFPPRRVVPSERVGPEYRLSPGVAVRIGILGIVAIAVFSVLFLRLWALQVLSGTQYLRAAQNNQLRTLPVQAPRGAIVDRNGVPLVTNVAGTSIRVWASDLAKHGRYTELQRLARLVHVPFGQIAAELRKHAGDPLAPVTVDEAAHDDVVFYLSEHRDEFPGVEIARTYLRHYPYSDLAAQVLGAVGEVSQQQLDSPAGRQLRG